MRVEPARYGNMMIGVTFSGGLAARRRGEDLAELIKRADDALYMAKGAGKNRIVLAETPPA